MPDKMVFESPRLDTAEARAASVPRRRQPFPVIVGCPRSGTSLLAVMLDSHPELAVPPETSFLGPLASLYGPSATLRRNFYEAVIADRLGLSNWSDFGLDKDAFLQRLEAIEPFSVSAGLRAFYAMYAESEDKPRCGEKTPGYIFLMPELAALLPETYFIHVIRDPGDTALSWRKTWFAPSQDLTVLGGEWRKCVEAGRRASSLVPRYIELRFEDLVVRSEATLKRVCEFIALSWDPAMLDYRARGAARLGRLQGRQHARGPMIEREQRTSIHANLTRAPDADRLDVWKREMTMAERRALEEAAGPLVRELGYAA